MRYRQSYFVDHEVYGRVEAGMDKQAELQPRESAAIKGDKNTLNQALAELDRLGAADERKRVLREEFEQAGPGDVIEVRPGYKIERLIDWTDVRFKPSLTDPIVPLHVPVGIAYLYLALCLRNRVYHEALTPVRGALRAAMDGDTQAADAFCPANRSGTRVVEPKHLLRAKADGDAVQVNVQVFFDLVWPVRFPDVQLPGRADAVRARRRARFRGVGDQARVRSRAGRRWGYREEMEQQEPTPGTGAMEITAFSVEENVKAGVFRFAPPLIDRSPDPKALYLMSRAFQVVFDDIADPRAFPPLPAPHAEGDLAIYRRYIEAAEELAESQLLCGSDNVTIRWDSTTGIEEVEGNFTSKEITRGFAVLLRQFDSKDEPASFQTVSGRLRKASKAATDDRSDERCRQIDAWRRAQGALHGTELQRLTRRKLDPALEYGSEHPPTYYLSAYNYGELIHWDRGRETIATWEQDPFHRSVQRYAFLEAATGLAHLYIGFSEVVRTAIGE